MSLQLKTAKDSLVSALYELSKAANEAAGATIDFYNASLGSDEEHSEVLRQLGDSLKLLTSSVNGVNESARLIASNQQIDPSVIHSSLLTNGLDVNHQITSNNNNNNNPVEVVKPKKKVEKDPNAPKKPLTVFFAYSAYIRQALREERSNQGLPALSSTEITQEISKKWNELGELEKEKWKEAYNEELENYQQNKEKYLEAKRNGLAPIITGPNPAPVPIPAYLLKDKSSKKREGEHSSSSDKKDKKKKSKKRKSNVPEGQGQGHHHELLQ